MKLNAKEYAKAITDNLGLESAIKVAETSKKASERSPTTFLFDEAIYYTDLHGNMQLAKEQSKLAGVRERRLAKSIIFWTQVLNILRKASK